MEPVRVVQDVEDDRGVGKNLEKSSLKNGVGKNLEKSSLKNGETKIDDEQCTRESPVKLSYSIEEDQVTEQQEPPFLRSVKQKISDNLNETHDFHPVLVQETATLTEPSKDGILDLNSKQKDVEDVHSSPEEELIEEIQEKSQFDKTVEKQKTSRGEELGTGYEEDSDI